MNKDFILFSNNNSFDMDMRMMCMQGMCMLCCALKEYPDIG
ncbi:hypothetical protein DFR55_1267 [Herbinix hemicellulosilytica]|uniref:Uncharacterized protein n=1 Tax=Herbinix hemicellulosilytica TaxID=1564487 RepID=A0A0H5SKX0_HERHM|nr:hypothetical protein DFR55_1267 [Herbinix hemicellulosilytica]CRZ35765.1 hypothetical protein HHT355_2582 [Herbinix hemicellulosilytica]